MCTLRLITLLVLVAAAAGTADAQSHVERWRATVDDYWDPALSTEEQLHVFDTYWTAVDSSFAAFHNLDIDWPALREQYRPEIEHGVSRGRFAGIMNHLALALREQHSYTADFPVNVDTPLEPDVPLMQIGGWWNERRFGACLTLTPDSALVVYDAVPDHPLGLAGGDIVLGYDGIEWHRAYRMMLQAELPIAQGATRYGRHTSSTWGSAPSAYEHSLMIAAGRNWHLFDEIDVVSHGHGDTLHLPVTPLQNLTDSLLCVEQLPVDGVEMPDLDASEFISWGVVDGTNVGYIFGWAWWKNAGSAYPQPDAPSIREAFERAVRELALEHDSDGIIFDFRTNRGGFAHNSNDGFALLFDDVVPTLAVDQRSEPDDHFAMKEGYGIPYLDIPGEPDTFYDGPIAILTGPGAFSAGDYTPLRLSYHPNARVFGKSTAASFAPARGVLGSAPGWTGTVSFLDAYRLDDPGQYLTHREQRVDEPVWHTRDAVVQGRDAVVDAALEWIATTRLADEPLATAPANLLAQNYPNPATGSTAIDVTLAEGASTTLRVYDLLGRVVSTVVDGYLPPGHHRFEIETQTLANGLYVYALRAGGFSAEKTMHVIR